MTGIFENRRTPVLVDLMRRYGLTEQADVTGLVDDRFARNASTAGIDGFGHDSRSYRAMNTCIDQGNKKCPED